MATLLKETMKEILTWKRGKKRRSASVSSSAKRPLSRRRSEQPGMEEDNIFCSTKVKYHVNEVTPFKKRFVYKDLILLLYGYEV